MFHIDLNKATDSLVVDNGECIHCKKAKSAIRMIDRYTDTEKENLNPKTIAFLVSVKGELEDKPVRLPSYQSFRTAPNLPASFTPEQRDELWKDIKGVVNLLKDFNPTFSE